MKNPVVQVVLAATLLTCSWSIVAAPPAAAHEGREVKGFVLEVGWGEEPAYTGFKNSVQLVVGHHDGGPVTNLGNDLEVEVVYGDASTTLPIEPNFQVGEFGEPGDYRAWITPTRPGDYTFHFTGSIEGRRINERFSSGPDTFASVEDVSAIQFPAKDPSTGALAERTDREIARLRRELSSAGQGDEGSETPAVSWIALGVSLVSLAGVAGVGGRAFRNRR